MKKLASIVIAASLAVATTFAASDWPQWRGPSRNGAATDSPPLLNEFPKDGLKPLWESEEIPSIDDGGLGSPVAAGGKAYLSVVWHTDVPSETRTINDIVMRALGFQSVASWAKELVVSMEKTRESIPPDLRGKKLDEFAQKWIDANLDKKRRQTTSGFVKGRFTKGPFAIPLPDYDKLLTVQDKPFANQAEFEKWVDSQGFAEHVKKEILKTVPPTRRVAEDTIVCLDLATGKTLWKAKAPGEPKGRMCSSTPCVVGGKVYALGSGNAYCVDAATGKQLWVAPMPAKTAGSSPIVVDDVFVANVGKLVGYDAATGKELWQQPKVGGANTSPVACSIGGQPLIICNGRDLSAVDPKTGQISWSAPGGGDCTPSIIGDVLATQTRDPKLGFVVYKLSLGGAEKVWNYPMDPLRSQASPIIHDGLVYSMDDDVHYCWELATGKLAWKAEVPTAISSPLIADGKIFVLINNGNNVQMLKAGAQRVELGKANVRAVWCPSPALADGKLLVRAKDRVRCFNLAAPAPTAAQ